MPEKKNLPHFDSEVVARNLTELLGAACVRRDEPMDVHTSYKIGGPADVFAIPDSVDRLVMALRYCQNNGIPYLIIGKGSNLLVGDKGIRGVVIQVADNLSWINVDGTRVEAGGGVSLRRLAETVAEFGLTGLEFAAGIPGTLGGAVAMNAGAYDGEMSQVITEVTVIDDNLEVRSFSTEQLDFGYRRSIIQSQGYVVVSAQMQLEKGEKSAIKAKMDELWERRVSKQPLDLPSCGSVFKRPPGHYAGKLVQDAGLRGARLGQAQISEKHSGFIVNLGGATAADVLGLIRLVQRTVKEKFGVDMETEVRVVGEF